MPMDPSVKPEPFKVTAQGLRHYGCTILRAPEIRKQLCAEMGGFFAGPMPPKKFMAILMHVAPEHLPTIPRADFSEVAAAPSEPKMYDPLIRAINTHRLCPGVTFKDISGRAQDRTKLKPDIGGFEGNEIQTYIELKSSARQDAFQDSHNRNARIEKQTDVSSKHRGQIIHYAAEQMAVQHRVSLLTVSMAGPNARFIRWDRSGAIVTEAFDYVDSPHLLAEFLIRFSKLNAAQRGFDTTVTPADQHETTLLSSALECHANLFGKRLPTQLEDQAGRQRAYKIPAIMANGTTTALVVGKPFCQPLSPCGRATRGYIAWDIVQGKLVFLKDTWRVVSPGSLSESEAYEHLKGHGVPHLPTIIAAADVTDLTGNPQQTLTQDFANHPWCRPHDSLRLLVHHRVIQELALPLSMVRNSRQLVQAIRNALVAIRCAHKAGNMLHRDVSVSNIMLDLEMNGILNDWDHNMTLPAHPDYKPHTYRTGHWQFASVSLLGNPHKPHEVHDDIESCVWALLYFSLHFIAHQSQQFSMTLFDQWEEKTCQYCGYVHTYGGSQKIQALFSHDFGDVEFVCDPLNHLIRKLTAQLHLRASRGQMPIFEATRIGAYEQEPEADEAAYYIQLFNEALGRDDWPVEDAVEDQLPPKSTLETIQANEQTRSASFNTSSWSYFTQNVRSSHSLSSAIAGMGMRSGNLPPSATMSATNALSIIRKIKPLPKSRKLLLAKNFTATMGPPPLPAILGDRAVNASHRSLAVQLASPDDGVTQVERRPRNLKRTRDDEEIEESLPMKHPRTGMHPTSHRSSPTR